MPSGITVIVQLVQPEIEYASSDSIVVVEGGQQGLQGVKGDPGTALAPISFAFGDASPRTVHTPTQNSLITSITLSITTPFNGTAPSLKVGTAASPELFMAAADSDPAMLADFQSDSFEQIGVGVPILLTTVPGAGATAGAGLLIIELLAL